MSKHIIIYSICTNTINEKNILAFYLYIPYRSLRSCNKIYILLFMRNRKIITLLFNINKMLTASMIYKSFRTLQLYTLPS